MITRVYTYKHCSRAQISWELINYIYNNCVYIPKIYKVISYYFVNITVYTIICTYLIDSLHFALLQQHLIIDTDILSRQSLPSPNIQYYHVLYIVDGQHCVYTSVWDMSVLCVYTDFRGSAHSYVVKSFEMECIKTTIWWMKRFCIYIYHVISFLFL
jgi:hypothetical protein